MGAVIFKNSKYTQPPEEVYSDNLMRRLCDGKPTRMRRLCLKTSEAEGRGGLGITSSSEEVYELML